MKLASVLVLFLHSVYGIPKLSPKIELHDFMDPEDLKFYFGSESEIPEYEIVDLPENLSIGRESVVDEDESENNDNSRYLSFKVFNNSIELNLHPNTNLLSPYARIIVKSANVTSKMFENNDPPNFCHYIHKSSNLTASISNCNPKEIHGILFMSKTDTLEILPLSTKLKFLMNLREYQLKTKSGFTVTKIPHLVKRSSFNGGEFEHDFRVSSFRDRKLSKVTQRAVNTNTEQPLGEIALFFDEAFYNFFAPFFKFDNTKIRDFILAYMNGVQALYQHHSLSRKVDFLIVYIELMKKQPYDLPHAYGERNALIDNFCQYQKDLNFALDTKPEHWDMAVYISALDFFAWDANGNKNSGTMGLATVGGVCNDDYNCVIAEFGSINQFGKPFPSSGFNSVYILAHEIGHNLGMSHDSTGNSCPKDGFVMSPSRGVYGETTWSSCSDSIVKKLDWAKCLFDRPRNLNVPDHLDAWKYSGFPGLSYSAKDQCEILLRDHEAYEFVNGATSQVCENLHCRTPNKPGFFFAGPALPGTHCGNGKWCDDAMCQFKRNLISTTTVRPLPNNSKCESECLQNGKGVKKSEHNMKLNSFSVQVCDDNKLCRSQRKPVVTFATEKCREFSEKLPLINGNGYGLQASYDNLRIWMSCAIFCKKVNSTSYFAPRFELNELGINPYFPDGTFCHNDGNESFYCMSAHCLPESTKFSKAIIDNIDNDL